MSESIRKVIQYDLWCAENAIDGLLNRKRRWQVSIPVQDDDTDVILSKPIGHARHLLSEVERLTALLEDARREIDDRESELAVYRVTVLAVNVAAGQGED